MGGANEHKTEPLADRLGLACRTYSGHIVLILGAACGADPAGAEKPRRGRFWTFALGFVLGVIALFGLALFTALRNF